MPLKVRAPEGLKCPKEGKPREYITDDVKGTEVPDTVFYRRLVDEGSLLLVEPEGAKTVKAKEGGNLE